MTTFTHGQIVSTFHNRVRQIAVISAIGHDLLGVHLGHDGKGSYEVVTKEDTRQATPAEQLGLKIGDVVTVGVGHKCVSSFISGSVAKLHRDDGTDKPLFEQDGETQYLDLTEITIGAPVLTPAQKLGLKEGDGVEMVNEHYREYFQHLPVHLSHDDGSQMPRFSNGKGAALWLSLEHDIRKLPEGPVEGVKWSDAPIGATHYSLYAGHGSRWHKLSETGVWQYAAFDHVKSTSWKTYTFEAQEQYARPATQKAIPGVVVEDLSPLRDDIVALDTEVRGKLQEVAALERQTGALNREVEALNIRKQDKQATLRDKGFAVVSGKLVAIPKAPVAPKAPTLADVPPSQWKVGDVVEAVVEGLDITVGRRYTVTDMCRVSDLRVRLRDDVNFPRRRPTSEFKLVYRA